MSARTIIWLRKLFSLSFLKRKQKEELAEVTQAPQPHEYDNPKPQEVEFDVKPTDVKLDMIITESRILR